MLRDTTTNPIKLYESLMRLHKLGYIFRGLPDASYCLKPFAFRPYNLEQASKKFPVTYEEING